MRGSVGPRRCAASRSPVSGRSHGLRREGRRARAAGTRGHELAHRDPPADHRRPGVRSAARARERVIPGGVNSPVRAFRAVGGTPRFMASGSGPWLTDVDGNRYVDLICSWGPMILGHAHPDVLAAVNTAAAQGFSFGTPSENEVLLAEEIVSRMEPVEQVRLVNSGTEATMSALRLARGFTGRDVVVKFAGCYHGHVDALLAAAGSGVATFALPDSAGVPRVERRRDDRAALQRPRGARDGLCRARPRDRRRHHRGGSRQHGRRARRLPASPRHCAASPPPTVRCSSPTR